MEKRVSINVFQVPSSLNSPWCSCSFLYNLLPF